MVKRRWLNRDIVVARAAELANGLGDAHQLTLAMLAQDLDIQVPSLYNHIKNIADLRETLGLYGLELLLDSLRRAAAGKSGPDALEAMAAAYRDFALAQPGVYPLTIQGAGPGQDARQALGREIITLLLTVLSSYDLYGDPALHVVRGLRALLHGFVSLEMSGGYRLPLDNEQSFHQMIATYIRGLTPAG